MRIRTVLVIFLFLGMIAVAPGSAGLVGVTGSVLDLTGSPFPGSFLADVIPTTPNFHIYLEATAVTIASAVGGIGPGTYDVYFVHFDQGPPNSGQQSAAGTLTFSDNVVGLVDTYAGLDAWDAVLFPITGTAYLTGISGGPYFRQVDANDTFTFSGNTVNVSFLLNNQGIDQGRIFLPSQPIPEPATWALIGTGFVVLGLWRRRGMAARA